MQSIAVKSASSRETAGMAHKLRIRAAGGGHEYLRKNLAACGEPMPASKTRLGREAWARSQYRYRLRHADGSYVNLDLSGTTTDVRCAWIGFGAQLDAVRRSRPDLSAFRTVDLPPEGKRGIIP
ncbi:MAG TPA: hypothetical protein VGN60_00870 [Devosia sp.]|jgi:hypothetical protein|nr:hypothetical protein [Devosia sp.]